MNLLIVTVFSCLFLCQINFGRCSHRHKSRPYYQQATGLHLEGDPPKALKRATYYTQQNTFPFALPSKSSYHVEVIEQKGRDNSWNSYLTSIGSYPDLYRNAFPYPGYPYGSNCQTQIMYQRESLEDPLAAFKSLNINPEPTCCYKSKQYLQPEVITVKSSPEAKLERIEVKSSDTLSEALKLANSLALDEFFPYSSALPCSPEISVLQPSIQISEPVPNPPKSEHIEETLVTGDLETSTECGIQTEVIDKIQVKEMKFGDNNSVLQVIVPEVNKEPCEDGKKSDDSESSEESDENCIYSKEGGPVIQNRFVLFHFRDNGAPIKSALLKLLAKI